MTISFSLQGRKEVKKLLVRMRFNRLDISCSTNIMLTQNEWNNEHQSVIGNPEVNISIQQLKTDLLKNYNKDFCNGVLIDSAWVKFVVKNSFNRPKEEANLVNPPHTIYVCDFALWWLENHASNWNVSSKKKMGLPLQNQYKKFVSILLEYESVIGERLKLRNIRISDLKSFADYLETENYQVSTIERQIGRFRFFLNRALEHNIEVSNSFKQRIYFDKDDDVEGVYLNEDEINIIYNWNFSYNDKLDSARDNLIISCWTALRSSDFLKNLDTSNIKDGFISIKTQKTKSFVKIPIHFQVEKILSKRFGNLPPKLKQDEYNLLLKTIGETCGFKQLIYGKIFDSKKKRKVSGYYPKFRFFSSHLGRKTFTSNLSGKIDDEVIMSTAGWSSASMKRHYDKTSKSDNAKKLQKFWSENN